MKLNKIILIIMLVFLAYGSTFAQYFGRNKVVYNDFHFKVLQTEHFDIYYYEEKEEAARIFAQMSERWYARLSKMLNHELSSRQAIILYASQPDFQQTNILSGEVGEGVGGVTEAFKRRVVMPFSASLQATDHVLGHELVHAFQFDMTGSSGPFGAARGPLFRLPLWYVEGMAEYLSIGPEDPHTAMWMRDAAKNEKLPTIRQMASPSYFPYRYGQAMWAYLAGIFGDEIAGDMMRSYSRDRNQASPSPSPSMPVFTINSDSLSKNWQQAFTTLADSIAKRTHSPEKYGEILVERKKGEFQMAPSLSPDGKYVVFISTRDLFSLDLYLGETENKRVIRRLTTTAIDPDIQSLQFLYSSGTWHPEGNKFAFTGISGSNAILQIVHIPSGKIDKEIILKNIHEAFNPSWSDDGTKMVFSGTENGFSDLYIIDINTEKVKRITDDHFTYLQPSWSPDGRKIAFVTDRFSSNLDLLEFGDYEIAVYDLDQNTFKPIAGFDNGKHINPQWSKNSDKIYFISDHDGISNLYSVKYQTNEIRQITNLFTGVSGITSVTPALSSSRDTDKLAITVYKKGEYNLYSIDDSEIIDGLPLVEKRFTDMNPALLPPKIRDSKLVKESIHNNQMGMPDTASFEIKEYRPKLTLDYMAPPTIVGGADRFGGFIGGGTSMYFSDMLGEHTVVSQFQINTRYKSLGAMAGYINRQGRMHWGVLLDQTPYIYGNHWGYYAQSDEGLVMVEQIELYRQVRRALSGLLAYPLSKVKRFEFSGEISRYSFTNEVRQIITQMYTGNEIQDEVFDLGSPDPLFMQRASFAFVHDNALYGYTSPLMGSRYRIEWSPTFGTLNFHSLTLDFRQYWMPVRPFTLAFRGMHVGRHGKGADDSRFYPMYLGYQHYVRGYEYGSFTAEEVMDENAQFNFNRLLGSKILVANFELRFPPLGIAGVGQGYYGALPIELALFYDIGVTWDSNNTPSFWGGSRKHVSSYGLAIRMNLMGFAIVELDIVRPLQRPQQGWMIQFGFTQGF